MYHASLGLKSLKNLNFKDKYHPIQDENLYYSS